MIDKERRVQRDPAFHLPTRPLPCLLWSIQPPHSLSRKRYRPSDHPPTQLPWLPKMTRLCPPHGSRKPGSSMKIWRWQVVKGICNDAEGRSWPHGRASSLAAGDDAQLPTAPTHLPSTAREKSRTSSLVSPAMSNLPGSDRSPQQESSTGVSTMCHIDAWQCKWGVISLIL